MVLFTQRLAVTWVVVPRKSPFVVNFMMNLKDDAIRRPPFTNLAYASIVLDDQGAKRSPLWAVMEVFHMANNELGEISTILQ